MDDWIVGAAISKARKAAGMTASAASARMTELGVPIHRVALSKIESGERSATVNELLVIAIAFNTSPAALLFGHALVDGEVEIIPDLKASAIVAVQWFSGEDPDVPVAEVAPKAYAENNRGLAAGRELQKCRHQPIDHAVDRDADPELWEAWKRLIIEHSSALFTLRKRLLAEGLIVLDDDGGYA